MSSQSILSLFIVFFILEFAFNTFLTIINIRHTSRSIDNIPEDFRGYIDPDTYRKSVQYTVEKGIFSLVSGTFHSAVILVMVLTGFFGVLDDAVMRLTGNLYIEGIIYIGILSFIFYVLNLPFSIYSTFVLEARYGFNKTTVKLFITDTLKGGLVSAVILTVILYVLFFFMDKKGDFWWVIASAGLILFQLFLSVIYPLVIAPLFNKFTPLEDGELKELLEDLASKNGFTAKGIYVMDGSRRSVHSNAYFTGLGRSKRIVLYDTLVEILTPRQLAAVLAHEIGHAKLHHLAKGLVLSFFVTVIAFFTINLMIDYLPLYRAFGFSRASYHAILVILGFCSGPFTFFITPLFTMWSRKHEYEADRYAVRITGRREDLKEGLIILTKENLSNLTPHPLYSFFNYSHPAIGERIKAIDSVPIDS